MTNDMSRPQTLSPPHTKIFFFCGNPLCSAFIASRCHFLLENNFKREEKERGKRKRKKCCSSTLRWEKWRKRTVFKMEKRTRFSRERKNEKKLMNWDYSAALRRIHKQNIKRDLYLDKRKKNVFSPFFEIWSKMTSHPQHVH